MSISHTLLTSRFYGAKSEPIDSIDVVREEPATFSGDRRCLVRVTHGNTADLYQLLLDTADNDVLGARATELGQALSSGKPAGFGTWHAVRPIPEGLIGRPIHGEQSNTSLIFSDGESDRMMVKYFRKIEPGINPEIELLSGMGPCENIAALYGWSTTQIDGQEVVLAVAQEFISGGRDGWVFALEHANNNESFAHQARELGRATANVHQALIQGFGQSLLDASQVQDRLISRAQSLSTQAPLIKDLAQHAIERYQQLEGNTPAQRVHGDLHLGQVLRTTTDYILIDFEGEPARPIEERRQPDAAVRDIAGLVRSIDYAAHSAPNLENPAVWAEEATHALLEGYGVSPSNPFLAAYVLDKALYEVAYEHNNRPDWEHIPAQAVRRLLED